VHSLTGQLAHVGTTTEAYTWLGTGMGAGIAVGAGLGGTVVEGAGTTEAFLLAACAVALGAVLAGARPVEPPAGLTRQTTRPEPD
jgi:predicted MFS family arabinose efflux permease